MQNDLLARFGLTGSDLLQSSPLLQRNSLLGGHTNNATAMRPPAMSTATTHSVDSTKSVRCVCARAVSFFFDRNVWMLFYLSGA